MDQEARISKLNQKLKNIEISDRDGRLGKLNTLEEKLAKLEERFEGLKNAQEGDFKELRGKCNSLYEEVDECNEHWKKNFSFGKLVEAMLTLEEKLLGITELNRQQDSKITKIIEERAKNMKSELTKERKIRSDCIDDIYIIIKETFPKLEELLAEEVSRRCDADEAILKKLDQESCDLELDLSKEKNNQDENQRAIFDIVRDIVEKVKRELESEQKERETSGESLMRLLQDSVSKLNSIVINN